MHNSPIVNSEFENAKVFVRKYHNELPVKVGNIATDLKIKIKRSTLPNGISGEIRKDHDGFTIKVNRHDTKERQRFTVAHEISHYILHKDLIGDGIVDDALYRSKLSDKLEAEANKLAAEILMPWSHMQLIINELESLKGEALYEALASKFEVSTTAIKIRLGKL